MIDTIQQLIVGLWHQDFALLSAPHTATYLYFIIGIIIMLESGFLPAAPLPCDSLLVVSGILAIQRTLKLPILIIDITIFAVIGSWLAYLQGKWLYKIPLIHRWVDSVPEKRNKQVENLLNKYGLASFFISRFIPVARNLTPLIMGLKANSKRKFFIANLLSALIWSTILIGGGFMIQYLPGYEKYKHQLTTILLLIPLIGLTFGIISAVYIAIKNRKK